VPDKSKFDKFVEGGDITLNCFIPSEEMRDIFDVTISNANNSSLAEAIRNRHLDRFQEIDSTNLALYKVEFVVNSIIINTLRNNSVFKVEGAEIMEQRDFIYNHFSIQP
jgi:hypothetical protein